MSTETPYLDKIFIENLMIGVKKQNRQILGPRFQ